MPFERDRTEQRCEHCGRLFGDTPDAPVLIKPITDGPTFCRKKGINGHNGVERCRRLLGPNGEPHAGRCVFRGEGDAAPADPAYHEACWRLAFPKVPQC